MAQIFKTATQSYYLIDEDEGVFSRIPSPKGNQLRQDDELLELVEIITFEPDVMGEFMLHGVAEDDEFKKVYTYRRTSAIEWIRDLPESATEENYEAYVREVKDVRDFLQPSSFLTWVVWNMVMDDIDQLEGMPGSCE
jgi:hypothetical protein